ncbi:striatin-like isoform X1 [Limulus polyphemus]|uniref:Striatin-like isoform X1 n=1 Tax=Limulus polyphemus TaxID=6850 RepID=A0ABM1RUX0_LIMPO|nr:striatin-like isoform X1 [Limulus polyphemus]
MDDLMMEDAETEEVLSEFSFLGPNSVNGSGVARSQGEIVEWGERSEGSCKEEWGTNPQAISKMMEEFRRERNRKGTSQRPTRSALQAMLATLSSDSNEENSLSPVLSGSSSFTPSSSAMLLPVPAHAGTEVSSNILNGDNGLGEGLRSLANYNPILGFETALNSTLPQEVDNNGMQGGSLAFGASSRCLLMSSEGNDESMDTGLGLGELAGITVSNEAESNYDISASKEVFRKTWNAKYTLRR